MSAVARRRIRGARCVAAALAALVAASCGFPTQRDAHAVPDDNVPDALRTTDTDDPTPNVATEPAAIWFVRDTVLDQVQHRVAAPATADTVVAELLLGPTEGEQGRSFRSAIPDATVVVSASTAGGLATVELAPEFAEIPVADQVLAVGQLVLTLTDLRGVGRVRFQVDDAVVAVPLPTGEASDQTVSRDDYLELVSP